MNARTLLFAALLGSATACASAAPEAARPTPKRRLVQTFALYRIDERHDLTEGVDPAALPTGIELVRESPGYFRAVDTDPLRAFVRDLFVPAGSAVVYGSTAPRTYLVESTPILGDLAIAGAARMKRNGIVGVMLVLRPEAFATLRSALSSKGSVLVAMQGTAEAPGSLELLGQPLDEDPYAEPRVASCFDYEVFVPLGARDGESPQARAAAILAQLPAASPCPDSSP